MNYEKNGNVSVIIPVFNVEEFLADCLDSVINQTYRNLEIIVVNDGSTDDSLQIIKEFQAKDKRIRLIEQENMGPSAARNRAIEASTGEFIAFVDSDDWIDLDFIEKLYNAIIENNADIAAASIIRKRKNSQKYRMHYTEVQTYSSLKDKVEICKVPQCCYIWNKLYTAELVKNKIFKENAYFEDVLWTPQVLKEAGCLVTVPNINYYYRVNNNSIVKKPTPQKQKDSYFSKKYIINFFRRNNLQLAEKEKNLTKSNFSIGQISLLKIKEKDFLNTCYLFGFLPILKFRDFDSHYIFNFLGIRLCFKHKSNINYIEAKSYGINKQKRNPQLIVSLTTHPARINYVHIAINTLLRQTCKPDRIILWLADSEFPNKEADLPQELLKLKDFGLEIKWCPNYRSYKKILPTLQEFPNDIIVTADDDLYYAENWLESLYSAYLDNPKNIYVKRAVKMQIKNNKIMPKFSRDKAVLVKYHEASFSHQLMSGSGCLFPPKSLHQDIFNSEKFLNLIPTHDDIYLWVMAILNGTKIAVVDGYDIEMLCIDGTSESALCKINNDKGSGMAPDNAFAVILNEYPQIKEILENERVS